MTNTSWIQYEHENFIVFNEFSYYKTIYGKNLMRDDFYDVRSPFLMNSQLNKTSIRQRKKKLPATTTVPEQFLKRSAHVEAVARRIKEVLRSEETESALCANAQLKSALDSVTTNASLLYSDRDFPSVSRRSLKEGQTIAVSNEEGIVYENTESCLVTVQSPDGHSLLCPPSSSFLIGHVNLSRHLESQGESFDLIVMDPPWQNRSVKRKSTYAMFDNNDLRGVNLPEILSEKGLVAMWVTNSHKSQKAAVEILKEWGLQVIATWHWLKITKLYEPVCQFAPHHKVPFESALIACRPQSVESYSCIKNDFCLASIPHGFHSKKPPIHALLKHVGAPIGTRNLELYARCLQPHFLSIGYEPLCFQDSRFFRFD